MAHLYKGEITLEEEKKAKTAAVPAEAAEKKAPARKAPAKKAEPAEEAKEPAKKAPAKKAEPAEAKKPSAAALKAALAQAEERESGKKRNTVLLRVLAFVMWALAIVAMYLPQIGELELPFGAFRIFVLNYNDLSGTPLVCVIVDVVVAIALCIGAALLWKKANHIHPVKSHNKIVQFIWNQLGLIMAFLIFFVIGLVLILKNDKLDAKTKRIAIAALAVITLLVGSVSADYHPVTQDEVDQVAKEYNIDANASDAVIWTTYGRKYHLFDDCQAIANSTNKVTGSLNEAAENHRFDLCSFCAKRVENGEMPNSSILTPTNP